MVFPNLFWPIKPYIYIFTYFNEVPIATSWILLAVSISMALQIANWLLKVNFEVKVGNPLISTNKYDKLIWEQRKPSFFFQIALNRTLV